MSTIQDVRRRYPQLDQYGYSDTDIVNWLAKETGREFNDIAEYYGLRDPNQGDMSRGFAAGMDSMAATGYGLVGLAGDATGLDSVRDWGVEGYQRKMGEIALNSRETDQVEGVSNLGDAADFVQYYSGYAVPQAIQAAASGGIGGLIGKQVVKQGVKKKLGDGLETQAKDLLAKGKKTGQYGGIGAQAIGTELGATYGQAVEEAEARGESIDDINLGRVGAYGTAAGLLELGADVATLGLARVGPAKDILKNANKTRLRSAASRGLAGAGTEAVTEGLQTGLEDMGAGRSMEDARFFDPTAMAAGAIGGGQLGVLGGVLTTPQQSATDPNALAENAKGAVGEQLQLDLDDPTTPEQLASRQQAEAEETARQKAQQEAQEDSVYDQRVEAAKIFTPQQQFEKERKAARDKQNLIDIANPETDLGKRFKQHLRDLRRAGGKPLYDDAALKKEQKAFLKGYDDGQKDQYATEDLAAYEAELDRIIASKGQASFDFGDAAQAQAQDTQEEAAPAKAPKPESAKVAEARAYAEEVLGPEWETVGGLSQEFANRKGFYRKDKDGKTTWQRSVDREAAALQETTTPEVDSTTEEAPVNALLDNESSSDQDLDQQSETSAASTLPTVLGGFLEEGHKGKALTENQASVATVLRDAFLSNEEDTIQQADGTLNPTIIAEKAGIKNRQAARRAIQSLQKKIADAYGVSVDQVKQRLNETNITSTEAFDQNAPTQELDTAELGEGMGTSASVGQGAYTDVAEEDQAWTQERANEPDQYENKRQEIADKSRVSLNAQMIQQYGKEAIAQWRGLVSDGAVDIKDISKKDLVEWVAAVAENREGQITDEQLGKDQREIERRYATEAIDNEGLGASSAEITEGGDTVEQVGTENTGAPPEGNPDDFTAGENKTAKVETKPKKKLRKKSDPDVSTREQNNRLMPETFKTGEAFVADAYHGTTTDIVEFDNSRLGDNTGAASAAEAFFFAGKGETASSYAESTSPRQQEADFNRSFNVAKKWLSGKTLNAKDQETLSAMLDRSSELDNGKAFVDDLVARTKKHPGTSTQNARKMAQTLRPAKRPQVQMRRIKMDNPLVKDFKGKKFRDETYASLIKKAKAAGHDGVVLLNTYDVAGKRKEDLTDADMDTIFGVFDAKDVTNTFKVREDNTKFGVPAGSFEPASRAAFEQEVKNLTGSATNMRIHVFDTEADALAAIEGGAVPNPDVAKLKKAQPYGWVVEDDNGDPHAHFILDRVPAGREKSAFLHEVGGHMGIDTVIEAEDQRMIATQIYRWAGQNDNSLESTIARRTITRINIAAKRGGVSDGAIISEAVAYFLEEAAIAGVEPSANSPLGQFIQKLRDFFIAALDKIGFGNTGDLTTQDVVDLAYGAAYIELVHGVTEASAQNPVTAPSMSEARYGLINRDWVGDTFGDKSKQAFDTAVSIAKSATGSLKFVHNDVRDFRDAMPALGRWYDAMLKVQVTTTEIRRSFQDVVKQARTLKTERRALVNKFLGESTFDQQWGYDPKEYHPDLFANKEVKVNEGKRLQFNRLTDDEKNLVADVFAHGERMRLRKQALAKKLGVAGKFFMDNGLEGPYAPLKRFGKHVAQLKSGRLREAEIAAEAEGATKKQKELYEKLKSDPAHYVVSFFDTDGQAQQFVDANKGNYAFGNVVERTPIIDRDRISNPEVYEKVMGALAANENASLDPAALTAFRDMIKGMYFQSMDERSARTSGAKRLNRAGYEQDMLRSFRDHANSEASLIAQMENGTEVNTALAEAANEVEIEGEAGGGLRDPDKQRAYNRITAHYKNTLIRNETPIQDRITTMNSVYMLLTSVGYHLTNATQPVMVTIPRIAGDFGNYGNTWSALFRGYKYSRAAAKIGLNLETEIDFSKVPQEYHVLLKTMQDRNLVDQGMEEDGSFNRFNTGFDRLNQASDTLGTITSKLYNVAKFVEAQNRISTAVAAYDTARANPAKLAAMKMTPQEYAIAVVEDTQGNFSNLDAPLLIKSLPKVVTQYRKYQLLMAWHYTNSFKQAFAGETPEMKAAGRRVLAYSLAHVVMGSGATGVPLTGLAFYVATMFGDDEPQDMERWIKANIDDGALGTALSRGVFSTFGLDLSTKLDQSKIFSVLPYADLKAGEAGAQDVLMGLIGPAGTTGVNFFRAAEYYKQGDLLKGIEYSVPKGIRTAAESYRLATEGYTTRAGTVVVDPREIDIKSLLINAMGLPATEVNRIKWTKGQQYELEQYFSKESSKIRKAYIEATRNRDRGAQTALRQEFRDLQKAKDRVRPFFNNAPGALNRQSISTLLRAPRNKAKLEKREQEKLR